MRYPGLALKIRDTRPHLAVALYYFPEGDPVQLPTQPPSPHPLSESMCSPSRPCYQMPYEAISEEQYNHKTSKLRTLDFTQRNGQPPRDGVRVEEVPDKFCETDACINTVRGCLAG